MQLTGILINQYILKQKPYTSNNYFLISSTCMHVEKKATLFISFDVLDVNVAVI